MTLSEEKKIDNLIFLLLEAFRDYDDYLIAECFKKSGLSDVLDDYLDEYKKIHGSLNGYCDEGFECPF